MQPNEIHELTLNDVLVKFDAFGERQHARTGAKWLSDEGLDGLVVANEALAERSRPRGSDGRASVTGDA